MDRAASSTSASAFRPTPLVLGSSAHPPPSYPDHIHSPVMDVSQPFALANQRCDLAQHPHLLPYLGLRSRLFLSLVSPVLIALLFVATTIISSFDSINSSVSGAKDSLMAACNDAERQASLLASLPHWMADSLNDRTASAIEATVRGLWRVLTLAVTGLGNLLVFLSDIYRSLFLCFIELLVRGSLAILMAAVALMNTAVREAAQGIQTAIEASISGINTFLSTTISAFNEALSLIGHSITVPTIAQPDLSALNNVNLPTSFEEGLLRLNSSLPTLNELRERLDDLILLPFDALRRDINETMAGYTFNRTLLPVPVAQNIVFCDQLDTTPIDDLAHDIKRLLWILLGILAVLLLLLTAFNLFKAWYSWKCLNTHLERTAETWKELDLRLPRANKREGHEDVPISAFLSKPNLFALLTVAEHPLLFSIASRITKKTGLARSARATSHLRWWMAFVGNPMAVAVLVLGLVGFMSAQVQLWALSATQDHYQNRLTDVFTDFSQVAIDRINNETMTASYDFANRSNILIIEAEGALNDKLFSWVNTTTNTMNATVNELVNGVNEVMNSTFVNTPLYDPLQTFLNCIILNKLLAIESALSWIQNNSHVQFDRVPDTVLMLSPNRSAELVSGIANASGSGSGSGSGGTGVIDRVGQEYRERLYKERLLYSLFLAIYGIVVLVATVVAICYRRKDSTVPLEDSRPRRWMRERSRGLQGMMLAVGRSDEASGRTMKEHLEEKDYRMDLRNASMMFREDPPGSARSHPSITRPLSEDQFRFSSMR